MEVYALDQTNPLNPPRLPKQSARYQLGSLPAPLARSSHGRRLASLRWHVRVHHGHCRGLREGSDRGENSMTDQGPSAAVLAAVRKLSEFDLASPVQAR